MVDSVWYNENGIPDSSVNYYYSYVSHNLISNIRDNFTDSSTVRTRYDDNEQPLIRNLSDSIRVGEDKVVEHPDEVVAYPGNDSAMNAYFQYQFDKHRFNLILQGTSGFCTIKFKVNKNGRAFDITNLYCDNNSFRNVMSDGVRNVIWLPAIKDGKPVTGIKEVSEMYSPSISGLTNDNQRRYFFDNNFNEASQGDALYSGKIKAEDNLIKLTVRYHQQSNRLFSMHFTDSTLQTANGQFESFYPNDQKQVRGNFMLGRKNGLWMTWDNEGRCVDSTIYVIGAKTYETSIGYQPEGGPGLKETFDYANGKKRTVYYSNRKITSDITIPLYGKEEGDTNNIFTNPEVAPSFQEGPDAWDNYINEYVNKKMGGNGIEGICVVRFIVNIDGKISDAEALTLKGTALAKTIINGVMTADGWQPAIQNGKKVKAYVILPMRYYFIRLSNPVQHQRYIHPVIINSVKRVSPIYNPN